MTRFVIKREDRPGEFLRGCGIGCNSNYYTHSTEWTDRYSRAIHFELEEAKATLKFITNVINQELGEQLTIEEILVREGEENGV